MELHGAPSGCGANDKLPAIYDFIATHGADLRRMAAQLGVELDDATHDMLVSNAVGRTQFSDGSELLNDLKTTPDAKVAELEGAHREVIVAVNTKFGTTLDREALRAAYPDLQAFNVDAWSFVTTARLLTDDPQEASELAAAMTYYNLATACVLAGKSMRVVVVK